MSQAPLPAYPHDGAPDLAAYGKDTTAGGPRLANWGRRVVSGLIDTLIISVPNLVVYKTLHPYAAAMTETLITLAFTVIYAWLEGTAGQTPGKMAVGTRTVRQADGELLGFGRALGRKLLHILDLVPCYLGFLWPAWDAKRQTFADKIVHSVVIRP
ncbi:RDD family protein [Actinacidiphila paucisporea]|uniref:Serine/threonine protein kinase n=1 Tax=Actinacidiphila paucisporea TaxID=310782 RepID=A0A1M7QZV1_9ACTN|nr:RDD family protein [Actinacidiphila paucisporea]SHN37523.1 serine/threonine protein kinase [Actinacidiphila paucisporea]